MQGVLDKGKCALLVLLVSDSLVSCLRWLGISIECELLELQCTRGVCADCEGPSFILQSVLGP